MGRTRSSGRQVVCSSTRRLSAVPPLVPLHSYPAPLFLSVSFYYCVVLFQASGMQVAWSSIRHVSRKGTRQVDRTGWANQAVYPDGNCRQA